MSIGSGDNDRRQVLKQALRALDEMQDRLDAAEASRRAPIAVVGLGCRYPGGVSGPDDYWRMLCDGVDAVTEVPGDRWDAGEWYDPDRSTPGKSSTRWGGFLDRIDQFDPHFFGISPREASMMDPQHRLVLEVAWEAIEHAGIAPDRLAGSQTAVFLGITGSEYHQLLSRTLIPAELDPYVATGNFLNAAAGRLSYLLGLHGPSVVVDSACSSSLVAVHLACQSLRTGECRVAFAGGVNVILVPETFVLISKWGMSSADGRCKAFDASADGFVRSEGCGIVVLKRLADALADGDRVLAVLKGSAVNQDGRSGGMTVPNGLAQQAVIRRALEESGVSPGQVDYVEAHGTGTSLGDPIEVEAMAAVLGEGRDPSRRLMIGSVKTNLGHTESASGIAGMIKTVLALQHGEIPPQLHLKRLTSQIPWDSIPVDVVTARTPWPRRDRPRIAGVSSFGLTGTNAHAIVAEAPAPEPNPAEADWPLDSYVFTCSAKTAEALRVLAGRHARHLAGRPDEPLPWVCFSANTGRAHFGHRLAIRSATAEALRASLAAFADGRMPSAASSGSVENGARLKVAFLFTGQGSQYAGMGRRLYETQPTFRRALDHVAELLGPAMARPLIPMLFAGDGGESTLDRTGDAQPALFALEYALAELWASWGIEPAAVIGHSLGEYVAACRAGVFSLADGLRLIAARGRLMQALPAGGAMAAVFADEARVRRALAGKGGEVVVAAINAPGQVVISGRDVAVQAVQAALAAEGVTVEPLPVSHAFHSPLIEPMLAEFARVAQEVAYEAPRTPIVSNITGRLVGGDEIARAEYWVRHAREPVRFAAGIEELHKIGCNVFLEIGPSPTLVGLGRRGTVGGSATWLISLRRGRGDWETILESLGELYVRGAEVDWAGFDRDYAHRRVVLPGYPFQRRRYWVEPGGQRSDAGRLAPAARSTGHPILDGCARSPLVKEAIFSGRLGVAAQPWLQDHVVLGRVTVPMTAYLEIALAAATEAFGEGPHGLEDMIVREPIVLDPEEVREVQLVLAATEGESTAFQIISMRGGVGTASSSWSVHATGNMRPQPPEASVHSQGDVSPDLDATRHACPTEITADEFYRRSGPRGIEFGPGFRGVRSVRAGRGEVIAEVALPECLAPQADRYAFHPAYLDACLQPMAEVWAADDSAARTYMLLGLESLCLYGRPGGRVISHVRLRPGTGTRSEVLLGDIRLFDASGELLAELKGLLARATDGATLRRAVADPVDGWLYEVVWRQQPVEDRTADGPETDGATGPGRRRAWVVFADRGGTGGRIVAELESRGQSCVLVEAGLSYSRPGPRVIRIDAGRPDDYRRAFREAADAVDSPCTGVLSLWSLDAMASEALAVDQLWKYQAHGCGGALYLAQALTSSGLAKPPRLWLFTRGAQPVDEGASPLSVAQATTWGLARTMALEHPELRPTCVDLDPASGDVEMPGVIASILADDAHNQVAFRNGLRYISRLVRRGPAPPEESVRLENSTPGVLDGLSLSPMERCVQGPGELEIRVEAVGLNFRDVLSALDLYPGDAVPLGVEAAGIVSAIGPDVEGFAVGDVVTGLATAAFRSHVTTRAELVIPMPLGFSFAEAATIPSAFLTAYHALCRLGKVARGERVLIHAASGGVGLAAVQLAQLAGCEVFATAGSPVKRAFLNSLGVRHTFDSRSTTFAEGVLRATDEEGVDLVLNSLTGPFIAASLEALRPEGRFFEIGKRDVWDAERVARVRPRAHYAIIDLASICRAEPARIRDDLVELLVLLQQGGLRPLPYRVFPRGQVLGAFRQMAQAKHIGKVVVAWSAPASSAKPTADLRVPSDAGSYLVVGGLGGLGLRTAQWLVERGARHLTLMGRGGPSAEARAAIASLERGGATVHVRRGDVSRVEDVGRILEEIATAMPPLRGVIHCAAVLDDGVILQQDWGRLAAVMAPKVAGAWILHQLTREMPLDFFIMFSSVSSVLGSPGQSNYSAANAFLDALAHHRRALGLSALSVNWGPWSEVGSAARPDVVHRTTARGVRGLSPTEGFAVLDRLLAIGAVRASALSVDWPRFLSQVPGGEPRQFFGELGSAHAAASTGRPSQAGADLADRLRQSRPGDWRKLLQSHVRDQVVKVLGLDPSFPLDSHRSLGDLGVDSLTSIELRNRLQAGVGRPLPATLVFDYPTVAGLVEFLACELAERNGHDAGVVKADARRDGPSEDELAAITHLSEAEAEALLLEELGDVGGRRS